jgi:hypothetical protein
MELCRTEKANYGICASLVRGGMIIKSGGGVMWNLLTKNGKLLSKISLITMCVLAVNSLFAMGLKLVGKGKPLASSVTQEHFTDTEKYFLKMYLSNTKQQAMTTLKLLEGQQGTKTPGVEKSKVENIVEQCQSLLDTLQQGSLSYISVAAVLKMLGANPQQVLRITDIRAKTLLGIPIDPVLQEIDSISPRRDSADQQQEFSALQLNDAVSRALHVKKLADKLIEQSNTIKDKELLQQAIADLITMLDSFLNSPGVIAMVKQQLKPTLDALRTLSQHIGSMAK